MSRQLSVRAGVTVDAAALVAALTDPPTGWVADAACRGVDIAEFFPDTPTVLPSCCTGCPVKVACLAEAVRTGSDGIWAATTPRDRARLADRLSDTGLWAGPATAVVWTEPATAVPDPADDDPTAAPPAPAAGTVGAAAGQARALVVAAVAHYTPQDRWSLLVRVDTDPVDLPVVAGVELLTRSRRDGRVDVYARAAATAPVTAAAAVAG